MGKIHKRTMTAADTLQLSVEQAKSPLDIILKGCQPAICQHKSGYRGASHTDILHHLSRKGNFEIHYTQNKKNGTVPAWGIHSAVKRTASLADVA
jgi:hypothetical protein